MSALLLPAASAQEFRGSITGRVTDTSDAIMPGVTVTATNTATNVPVVSVTNDAGVYTLLYLLPGSYSVSFELTGFKRLVRRVDIRVGDRMALDVTLETGALEETITVTGESPLLETASGSSGQVIDEKRIALLPLSDGNPFVLSRLAAGVAYTGDLRFSRPFDNNGTSSLVADGGSVSNEFTLDGAPNMANKTGSGMSRVAFVPPSDAVQEFKVETAAFDAQQGHTGGATINVTLKSGTNLLRGTGYGFLRDEKLSSNDFFLERAGRPKSELTYRRWGGTAGGPVRVPGMYDGRDRTFFFAAYERLDDEFPEPQLFTVPTEAERRGDFSALLAAGIVIYDPLTAQRLPDGRIVRTPFSNNVIPADRISPIARNYLQYFPAPNQPGDAQGRNNFLSDNPRTDAFYSISTRIDHQLTADQRVFVRVTRNNRKEARNNWTGEVNGIRPIGNFLFRINDGVTGDYVYTMGAATVLNVRGSWSRFNEPNIRQHEAQFDPSQLGFSAATVGLFRGAQHLPRFEFPSNTISNIGENTGAVTTHSIYAFQPTVTRVAGRHSLRAGYDFRMYRERGVDATHAAGRYDFRSDFTRQFDNSPAAAIGQELAAFMLGQPAAGFIDRNADRHNQTLYHGVFVQDDWKVSDRLTLNLGLRYEYEGATTDSLNRNVRGFDPDAALTIEAAARAQYAGAPLAELPLDRFRVRGGLQFADENNPAFWNADGNNIQPRLGFAYTLNTRTVLRGGWAIYTIPFIIDGVRQTGFSQATQLVPTLDNGLTFRANLTNPFPDGVTEPPGAALGAATFLGREIEFTPVDRANGQNMRWTIGLQRELPGSWVVEATYVGSRGYDLTTAVELNPIPREFLSTSPVRDANRIAFLTGNVANPFRGLVPGTTLNGNTVQRQQLLRPFSQFTSGQRQSVKGQRSDGSSSFHSGQVRAERRFTGSFTLLGSYTFSRYMERVSLLNPTDTEYEERPSEWDVPHRVVGSGIWELPFGRDRRFGASWGRLTDSLLGGWSVQAIFQTQSGRPLCSTNAVLGQIQPDGNACVLGNLYFNGDPSQLKTTINKDTATTGTFDTSSFYFSDPAVQTGGAVDPARQRADQRIRLEHNVRTFPTRLANFRTQALHLWDISIVKRIPITQRVRLQVHVELLNAFNRVQFENPNLDPTSTNFGRIVAQGNLPRNIQLAGKLTF